MITALPGLVQSAYMEIAVSNAKTIPPTYGLRCAESVAAQCPLSARMCPAASFGVPRERQICASLLPSRQRRQIIPPCPKRCPKVRRVGGEARDKNAVFDIFFLGHAACSFLTTVYRAVVSAYTLPYYCLIVNSFLMIDVFLHACIFFRTSVYQKHFLYNFKESY